MRTAALIAILAALSTGPALAQFQVEDATTASQEVELELNSTVRVGGVATGETVSEHEINWRYGAFEGWQVGLGFNLQNNRNEQPEAEGLSLFSSIAILGGETGFSDGLDLALVSELSFEFDSEDESVLSVGPAIGTNIANIDVLANGFMQIPFGGESNDIGASYAVGAMYGVGESISVGVEAHGEVPNVFNETPAIKRQEHFAGPAVSFTFEPEEDREVDLRLGSFFGLTPASPTVGLSANIELGF